VECTQNGTVRYHIRVPDRLCLLVFTRFFSCPPGKRQGSNFKWATDDFFNAFLIHYSEIILSFHSTFFEILRVLFINKDKQKYNTQFNIIFNITHGPCSSFSYVWFYYQLLHNRFTHSYMFRLTISAIISESSYIDISSVHGVSEW
jgi:hypothetical protein